MRVATRKRIVNDVYALFQNSAAFENGIALNRVNDHIRHGNHRSIEDIVMRISEAEARMDAKLKAVCQYLGAEIVIDGDYFVPKTFRVVKKGKAK